MSRASNAGSSSTTRARPHSLIRRWRAKSSRNRWARSFSARLLSVMYWRVPAECAKTKAFSSRTLLKTFGAPRGWVCGARAAGPRGRDRRGQGREERGIELGDECRKLRGHAIGKARRDALFVGARGTALGLRMSGRRREDDVGVVGHGKIRRARARRSRGVEDWLRRDSASAVRWIISCLTIIPLHWNGLLRFIPQCGPYR